jgi:KUP system potassium uptake protein
MITATFSLIQQVINSKAFPPLRMLYTSETIQGQVYIAAANWTLLILTIVLVAVFTNLTNLTNAYGFAVSTVMFTTSVMIAVQIKYVKHWPVIVSILYFVIFGFFDGKSSFFTIKDIIHVNLDEQVFSGEPPLRKYPLVLGFRS